MISSETIQGLKANFRKFYELIAEPLFALSDVNLNTLRRWCHTNGITDEMLAVVGGEHLFSAAFIACKAAGDLEFEKSEEQKRLENSIRLSNRDAEESRQNRTYRFEETAGQTAARLVREQIERDKKEVREQQERLSAAEKARAAENDLSVVPTLRQIRESGPLSANQQHKLSAVQLRHYLNNLRRIQAEDAARQQERG